MRLIRVWGEVGISLGEMMRLSLGLCHMRMSLFQDEADIMKVR